MLGGVAPIPWRLPEVEKLLAGQRITPELAAKAGEAAVAGARPLSKNGYKVPLTRGMVARTTGMRSGRPSVRLRLRVERRDFLRSANRPAGGAVVRALVHAVSRLADGRHDPQLFDHLAGDLRGVTALRLTETSWLARADLKAQLDAVLDALQSGRRTDRLTDPASVSLG